MLYMFLSYFIWKLNMNLRWFTYTHVMMILLMHPKLLDGLNCKSKDENNGRRRSWVTFLSSSHFEGRGARSLVRNTSRVERRAGTLGWQLRKLTRKSITHTNLHKPNNKLVNVKLKYFWCTDKPQANTDLQNSPRPRLGGSHHLPPYSILCAWPWGQHSNVILS